MCLQVLLSCTSSHKLINKKALFYKSLQSKNGGVAAWEPAGAADWLEVRILTNWSCSYANM